MKPSEAANSLERERLGLKRRDHLKLFKTPENRWLLPIWNHHRFDSMFVDENGSCESQHVLCYGKMHRYQGPGGELMVVLCPERLSYDDKQKLIQDIPEGSWEGKLAVRKIDMIQRESAIKKKRLAEETKSFGR